MDRAKLEIIVTHYNESWAVCSKFFKMLDVQRGMAAGGEVRVTIVQDGDDGKLDTAKLMKMYPFITSVIEIPHKGVSAARNAGIDSADAEWVMFCDCDDMLYSCDSLRRILDGIDAEDGRADLIRGPFLTEIRTKNGEWITTKNEKDWVFIHGKIWRLEWLRKNGIRFDERLDYSEDSLFCETAELAMDPKRIGKLTAPVYMWCLRSGSCTSDESRLARNREHLAWHRCYLPGICRERGRMEEARTTALRGIFDSYHEYTGGTIGDAERMKLEEIIAKGLVIPWLEEAEKADEDDQAILWKVSKESAMAKKQWNGKTIPFGDWVENLKARYGE